MSVYVMCESVVSKQPVGKSLKDEGTVHEGQSTPGLLDPTTCGRIRGITSGVRLKFVHPKKVL